MNVSAMKDESLWDRLVTILEMVRFSHSIFALPVALMSAFIASNGFPSGEKLFWIVMAMLGARNAGMAFNRIVDHEFDAVNPRTKNRALPQGKLTQSQVKLFVFGCSALFIVSAFFLGHLAFILSPFALAIVFFYSYTKRFTKYSHVFLGVALGLAPFGAWVGIRNSIDPIPIILGIAIVFWVAGFDTIYSCQDADVDNELGLHSIPQYFGIKRALQISELFHVITVLLLFYIKSLANLGSFYLISCIIVTGLLVYEHYLVKPNDLTRLDKAFCTLNAMVSVVLFAGTVLDVIL